MRARGRAISCSSFSGSSCIPIPSLPSENSDADVVAIVVVDVAAADTDAIMFVCVCARACALKLCGSNLPPKPGSFSGYSSISLSLNSSSPSMFPSLNASDQEQAPFSCGEIAHGSRRISP